ncbi:hypothetical protein CGI33_21025 [Vibrio parahaemolyticus]|nr:hypothetical protein CGI33_21025 [Vibrio parahaemolyticus]
MLCYVIFQQPLEFLEQNPHLLEAPFHLWMVIRLSTQDLRNKMTNMLYALLAKTVFKTKLPSHSHLFVSQVIFIAFFVTLADVCTQYIISNKMTLDSSVPEWTDYLLIPFDTTKAYVLIGLVILVLVLNVLYDKFRQQQKKFAIICINNILATFSLFTGLLVFMQILSTNVSFLQTPADLNIFTAMFLFISHVTLKMSKDIIK